MNTENREPSQPQGVRFYSSQDLEVKRLAARARAFEAAGLKMPEAPGAPSSSPQAGLPPSYVPVKTSGLPVRVSSRPRQLPVPTPPPSLSTAEAKTTDEPTPEPNIPESGPRHPRLKKRAVSFGVLTMLGLSANQLGVINTDGITSSIDKATSTIGSEDTSSYAGIELPAVTNAEGLNPENCKRFDATVASLDIVGSQAIRYELQTADSVPLDLPPYIGEGQLSALDTTDTDFGKFETKSGFPEMTVDGVILEIRACQQPNTRPITIEDDEEVVHLDEIDFSARITFAGKSEISDQERAYMTNPSDSTFITWPLQTFLAPNAELYTDASLEAVKAAHANPDQKLGVFNEAVKSILAGASNASTTSEFNKKMNFLDKDTNTLYEAIRKGLKKRLGIEKIDGTISGITPELTDKQATLLFASPTPEENFTITNGEVAVGRYVTENEEKQGE